MDGRSYKKGNKPGGALPDFVSLYCIRGQGKMVTVFFD
jgi:hypothetical protein